MKRLIVLFFLVLSYGFFAWASPAPDFQSTDINGKSHTLAEHRGKIVVLEWFNPGCPYVKKHYTSKNMQQLQEKYTGKGVVWFTINSGAPGRQGHMTNAEAQKLAGEWGIKATAQLVDEPGTIGKAYDAKTTPHLFVIDKEGKIAYQGAIDDNDSASPSSIQGAKNYVVSAVDDLLSGKTPGVTSTEPYGCSVKYAK